jgi:hypothetical protein
VRESVRCEGRGGVRVGECECHTPKGTWSVRHTSERGEGSTFQFKKVSYQTKRGEWGT